MATEKEELEAKELDALRHYEFMKTTVSAAIAKLNHCQIMQTKSVNALMSIRKELEAHNSEVQ
tara:strand:+ start:348 stop:536 length:189 start_codon:yes stop_codon:yes gene_type:complete